MKYAKDTTYLVLDDNRAGGGLVIKARYSTKQYAIEDYKKNLSAGETCYILEVTQLVAFNGEY